MRSVRGMRWTLAIVAVMTLAVASCGPARDATTPTDPALPSSPSLDRGGDPHSAHGNGKEPTTLYVWAGDVARIAPDFLAVIDFDRRSPT